MLSNLRSGGVSLTCFVPVACRPFTQDSVFSFFGWGPRLPSDVCYLSVISQRQDSFEFTCLGVHVSAPWRCHGSWRRSTSSSETFPIKAGLSFYGGFEEILKTIDVGCHFFYHSIQYSTITSLPLHFVIPLQESTYVLAHTLKCTATFQLWNRLLLSCWSDEYPWWGLCRGLGNSKTLSRNRKCALTLSKRGSMGKKFQTSADHRFS